MPDAALYFQAVLISAGASALIVLALGGVRRPAGAARLNATCVLAIAIGIALSGALLRLPFSWPPTSALGRLLLIVLPATIGVELIAGMERISARLAWSLRLLLAASAGRLLLHGSVYLAGEKSEWTAWQQAFILAFCGAMLAAVWALLVSLADHAPGVSIPLMLCEASLAGGAAIMLAGYLAGGETALVLAAALAGAAISASIIGRRAAPPGLVGVGVVGLFAVLFIGRFFGRLSTGATLAILLAPLLSWATETPPLRNRSRWFKGVACLALAAIPLAIVLAFAKLEFDREMRPLLGVDRPPP